MLYEPKTKFNRFNILEIFKNQRVKYKNELIIVE